MELDIDTALLLADNFNKNEEYENEHSLIGKPLIDADGNYLEHLRTTHIFVAPNDDTIKDVFDKFISYKDNDTALKVGKAYQKKVSVFLVCNTKTRIYSCELDSYIKTTGIHKEYYESLKKQLNITE